MLNINAGALPEQEDRNFTPFKADVPCVIDKFQVEEDAQKGGLQYLSMTLQVVDGEYKGRLLFDDFKGVIQGTDQQWNNALNFNVAEASGAKLRTLLEGLNIQQLNDPSQLIGQTVTVSAYVNKKGYQSIGKYLPLTAATTQQPAPQVQGGNPFPQQPAPANNGGGW